MTVYLPVRVRYPDPSGTGMVDDSSPSLPYNLPGGYQGSSAVDYEFYFDVPAIPSLTAVQVAVWLTHPNVSGQNGLMLLVAGAGVTDNFFGGFDTFTSGRMFSGEGATAPLGPGLGTSEQNATFDIDDDAPATWDGGWVAPAPGRWRAANAQLPAGGLPASEFGTYDPSDGYTGAWRVIFRNWWAIWDAADPENPTSEEIVVPEFTVSRVALIINEPFDYTGYDPGTGGGTDGAYDPIWYDPAVDPDPSTGGTGGGVGGTGRPGLGEGTGGVGPVATGASVPPGSGPGGTGGGSLPGGSPGGTVYPAAGDLPENRDVDGLTFVATSMYRPDGTGGEPLIRVADFTDGSVEIPISDARLARLTVKTGSDLAGLVEARGTMLQAWFRGVLVFWGTVVTTDVDFGDAETMTIAARDPSLRLEAHFLRAGDLGGLITTATPAVPVPLYVNGSSMRLLRDAADNTAEQDTENYPVLGIADGTNTATSTTLSMEVKRSDQIWNSGLEMAGHLGFEFRLRPVADQPGSYVVLDTVTRLGVDRTDTVVFHKRYGIDNLEAMTWQAGAKLITHIHVLDRDSKYRFTEANTASASQYGVSVEWDATEYDAETSTAADAEAALRARGDLVLSAYSRPLDEITITPRPGAAARYIYLRDFSEGDTVAYVGKSGNVVKQGAGRILKVTLNDPGNGIVSQQLDVVESKVPGSEIGASGDA